MNVEKINEGMNTVLHLAQHIESLENQALELQKEYHATERGYFKPEEEEQVFHLLVSYWQSRKALLELALEMNDVTHELETAQTEKYIAFIIGYAAAAVLVDAARFLSEHFDASDVVKNKLNQPNPEFGIPANVYNTVQKSLNDPNHLWMIFKANNFYDLSVKELEGVSKGSAELQKLIEIIQKRRDRMNLESFGFAKERILEFGQQLANLVKKPAIDQIYEIQESISRSISGIKLKPGHNPSLPEGISKELYTFLKPGDVLVTRKEYAATNYFLPGFWPHAALYIGNNEQLQDMEIGSKLEIAKAIEHANPSRVLESLKDGVHIRSMDSPFGNDAVAIIRPKLNEASIASAIKRGLVHESKPYDFDFDFRRSDRLVCTEVVYRSYEGIENMNFKLSKRAGRLNLSAEDLLKMALNKEFFEPVAVFCPSKSDKIEQAEAAEKILKETIQT